ncbi:MAG: hypothetical protein ACK47B_27960 [Armatimonadota bacterium]
MSGLLLKTLGAARRYSPVLLTLYLAVLVLAWGHTCASADAHKRAHCLAAGAGISQPHDSAAPAGHDCPACNWQRSASAGVLSLRVSFTAPAAHAARLTPFSPFLRSRAPAVTASRGPPHS